MFKPHYTPLALIIGSLLSAPSFADEASVTNTNSDDIVISASRVTSKRVETGSSITVLDEQYLKENQAGTVADVLRDVPGVAVSNYGGITSVFIRGASSNQTLVIIDGVEVNDNSNITGGYNFSTLMADNIERIEILRGSQSALWGSDAMGGVINIVTKKGTKGFNPKASLEIGENNYHKENFNLSGANNNSHYSLSGTSIHSEGISSQKELTGGNEDDRYKNQTLALKMGTSINSHLSIDTVLRYNKAKTEFDIGTDAAMNANIFSENRQRLATINTHLNLFEKQWQNTVSLSYSDFDKTDSTATGQKIKVDLQSNYYLQTLNKYSQRISFIAEHEKDKYQSWGMLQEDKLSASGTVLGYGADWAKIVFFNAAIRHDFNDKFDDTTTHHIDISAWVSEGTRLHASEGTGVKNPTFGQLSGYNPSPWGDYVGNPDLKPEKSSSWDTGIEYNFADVDAYVDLTYFNSRYSDMHSYQSNTYVNLDKKTTVRGVELTGSLKMTTALRVNAAYTYMKTDDGEGNDLLRRPENTASINANYKYTDKLSANIGARYVGSRRDSVYAPGAWTPSDATLDSYTVINIGAIYQVHEHITVFARLENAFDEDYEEVSGYNTAERTGYIGFSVY